MYLCDMAWQCDWEGVVCVGASATRESGRIGPPGSEETVLSVQDMNKERAQSKIRRLGYVLAEVIKAIEGGLGARLLAADHADGAIDRG